LNLHLAKFHVHGLATLRLAAGRLSHRC
jgi:hypothetical protein